ncbi:hypothetical protein GCM10009540_34060 [Streptomyces turgidiscabies]
MRLEMRPPEATIETTLSGGPIITLSLQRTASSNRLPPSQGWTPYPAGATAARVRAKPLDLPWYRWRTSLSPRLVRPVERDPSEGGGAASCVSALRPCCWPPP